MPAATDDPALLQAYRRYCGTAAAMPAPGSLVGFLGPLQHVNTSRYSFGYYWFGNVSSPRPPLVLVPGVGTTINIWTPALLEGAAAAQEVIVFDLPGNGFTTELNPALADEPLSVMGMVDDILEFLDALGLQRPNILGSSFGGHIVAALAATQGGRVGKTVLAPGSAGSPNSKMPAPALITKALDGSLTSVDLLGTKFALDIPEGVEAACRCSYQALGGAVDPERDTALVRQLSAAYEYMQGPGVWDLLPNVTNPMLLVGGALDQVVPVQNVMAIAARVQRPWLAVYPKGRHAAICQYLDSFLALLDNFLENA